MLKKLVAYGVITAGVTAITLGAGPAQANDGPAPKEAARSASVPTSHPARHSISSHRIRMARPNGFRRALTSPRPGSNSPNPWWGTWFGKDQNNESTSLIYLCDIHILSLDHTGIGKNEENGKCAQSSFNAN